MRCFIGLHYQIVGSKDKPAILLLHGFMGSVLDWDYLVERLKDDYCLITIDLPGHGRSLTLDDSDYTIESTSSAIIDTLNQNKITSSHLCAYSMGGRVGYYLLIHYPEYFLKAIIESSTPGIENEPSQKERVEADKKLAEKLLSQPLDKFVSAWYRLPLFESLDKKSEAYQKLYGRRLINNPNTLAKSLLYTGTGVMPSLWPKLKKIESHLLLIVGQKDDKFKAIAHSVKQMIKNSICVEIENAGHNVHFEQPDRYIEVVRKFLK